MKICLITSLYKPYSKGGAERVVENIVDGLETEGLEVVVITTRPNFLRRKIPLNPPLKKGEITHPLPPSRGDISVIRFYPWNLFWFGNIDKKSAWLRLLWHIFDVFNFYSYFKIRRILKKEKPDLAMTHNLKGMGYTIPLAIRHSKIKHIHTLHDVQLVEPSGLLYQKNKKIGKQGNKILRNLLIKIYSWINIKLFGSPDIIISPSKWLLQFYEERGFFKRSKRIVIKNPILRTDASKTEFFYSGTSKNIDINLLYIGQIEEHKGIIFLIESIKKLSADMKIHLDVIGIGAKLEDVKNFAKGSDNIKIHGYVENNSLNKFFVQSDFLVVPSLCYENTPTVIYESFSHGVPVIASNIGGIPELVKEGYNGYMFEGGNFSSLKQAIMKCTNEQDKWNSLRKNALISIKGLGVDDYVKNLIKEINK